MMTTVAAAEPVVWYQTSRFRRGAIIALVVIGIVEGVYAIFLRENDFVCHITFGEHFRQGTPYASPGNYYPLGRVMLDATLTFGNYYVTRAACYALALAALAGTFW